ncbi:hypothetical protein [Rhizobium sp. N122]|uniref:hypothetical protein n=1 Tax=Rhizobium sp. N122 TaxID=1764272 RepID=UPI00117AB769|nr:hypothetical protein [Rhizobium sp. N122]
MNDPDPRCRCRLFERLSKLPTYGSQWPYTLGKYRADPTAEKIGSLAESESYLDGSDLPGASPSKEIVARTLLMQCEGQGFYKSSADLNNRWTLTWVKIGGSRQENIF